MKRKAEAKELDRHSEECGGRIPSRFTVDVADLAPEPRER
jgi:hypothetical protein